MADENLESAADISEEQKREAVKQAVLRAKERRCASVVARIS